LISPELIQLLKETFKLDWNGIHGVSHWARVRLNGQLIAQGNQANKKVVELFAFLHDSKRQSENRDSGHGLRAAHFINSLSEDFLGINKAEKELLCFACEHHSHGLLDADITSLTCWDADRLDLGRVNIHPEAERLGTIIAKDPIFLEKAYQRSIQSFKTKRLTEHNILNRLWTKSRD
jgi:uncharacterized protein